MKLVEEYVGVGELRDGVSVVPGVRYRISRYQAVMDSGMPIPGKHRIEGAIDVASLPSAGALAGRTVTLALEDGRTMPISVGEDGQVLIEGHGPRIGCSCC